MALWIGCAHICLEVSLAWTSARRRNSNAAIARFWDVCLVWTKGIQIRKMCLIQGNQATLPGPRSSRSEISTGGRAGSCNDSGCAALPVLFLFSIWFPFGVIHIITRSHRSWSFNFRTWAFREHRPLGQHTSGRPHNEAQPSSSVPDPSPPAPVTGRTAKPPENAETSGRGTADVNLCLNQRFWREQQHEGYEGTYLHNIICI